ncbi:hypothetical protein BGX34_001102 [Mortierella sp. NVP85]|nr:hypothetical protein BGX34_001102 [Mortierella sp. NVP85]
MTPVHVDGTIEPTEWVGMLIQRLESQGLTDRQSLGELTASDQAVTRRLSGLIYTGDIELLWLELQNYGGAIVMEVLRIYLQEIYDHRPVLECSELRARLSASIQYHKQGQYPELIMLHSQAYLDGLKPESRIILGAIVLYYTREFEEDPNALAVKLCSLLILPDASPSQPEVNGNPIQDEAPFLMEIWVRFFNTLWPDPSTLIERVRPKGDQDVSVNMKGALETWQFTPVEAAEKALRQAKLNMDEVESKTIQNRQSIDTIRTQMKQMRSSVVDGYKGIYNHLSRLSTCTKSIASSIPPPLSTSEAPSRSHSLDSYISRSLRDRVNGHSNTSTIPDLHSVRHGMISPGQPLSPSSTLCSRRNYSSPLANNSSGGLRPPLVQSVSQSSIASDASVDSAISNLTAQGSEYSGGAGGSGDTASIISERSKASIKTNDSSSGDSTISNGSDGYSFITAATSSLLSIHRPLQLSSATASVTSTAELEQENAIDRSDNNHSVERNSSVSSVSECAKAIKPAVGSMGVIYEGLKVLQEQVSLTETRNLQVLDRCVDAAVESRMEDLMRWEAMAKQYEELVKQLASAKAYQAKLEHENAAIKDLYDEASEENNVIFERFNDELESIFSTVNTTGYTAGSEHLEEARDPMCGFDMYHDRESQRSLAASASSISQRYQQQQQQHIKRSDYGTSPPLPPIPMLDVSFDFEASLQDLDRQSRRRPEEMSPPQPTAQQLQLLKKAIQDRSLAEQQARRATMQATYLRGLLEKHGIEADTEELFL